MWGQKNCTSPVAHRGICRRSEDPEASWARLAPRCDQSEGGDPRMMDHAWRASSGAMSSVGVRAGVRRGDERRARGARAVRPSAQAEGGESLTVLVTEEVRRGPGAGPGGRRRRTGGPARPSRPGARPTSCCGGGCASGASRCRRQGSRPPGSRRSTCGPTCRGRTPRRWPRLLGAERAYVGAVIYEPLGGELPFEAHGWRALVSVELVDAASQRPVGRRLVLERVVFGSTPEQA